MRYPWLVAQLSIALIAATAGAVSALQSGLVAVAPARSTAASARVRLHDQLVRLDERMAALEIRYPELETRKPTRTISWDSIDEGNPVEVVETDAKYLYERYYNRNMRRATFSWRATLLNRRTTPQKRYAYLQLFDATGEEFGTSRIFDVELDAGEKRTWYGLIELSDTRARGVSSTAIDISDDPRALSLRRGRYK